MVKGEKTILTVHFIRAVTLPAGQLHADLCRWLTDQELGIGQTVFRDISGSWMTVEFELKRLGWRQRRLLRSKLSGRSEKNIQMAQAYKNDITYEIGKPGNDHP